jgi:hypothetical protein
LARFRRTSTHTLEATYERKNRTTASPYRQTGRGIAPLKAFGLDLKVLLTTLPGGQDQYFKAMAELVPGDDFAGDTHFAGAH